MATPKYAATPGEVVGRAEGRGVVVKTGDSTLLIEEAQGSDGFCLVPRWRIGTRLTRDGATSLAALRNRLDALERRLEEGDGHARQRAD